MRKRLLAPVLLTVALATSGCVVHAGLAIPLGPPVVIAHSHAHSADCGHYRHGGRWYHSPGHHHGPRCGHKLRGGVWILVR